MNKLDLDTGEAAIFIRDMPRGVKDQFKAYCSKRGYTMKSMIIKLMRQCIDSDNIARISGIQRKQKQ